jgi:hypothetical protein
MAAQNSSALGAFLQLPAAFAIRHVQFRVEKEVT